jgi:hypothetical protein
MNENSVVVGVDGSPAARAALEYAARRNAPLRAVAAVALPEFWASYYGELVPPPKTSLSSIINLGSAGLRCSCSSYGVSARQGAATA